MGEPVLVDLNEESDGEEGDYESWQPDPIDADPSTARQTSVVILSTYIFSASIDGVAWQTSVVILST